jgi:hypothetical protein
MIRSAIALLVLVAGLTGATIAPAGAATVAPDQHFTGVVNGDHTEAVVTVACPGPSYPGQTGHPISEQYVAAILAEKAPGFTGENARRIVVRFGDDRSIPMRITSYGIGEPIPLDLNLPCEGTGKVRFLPRPRGESAVPDTVVVTYENIAA